MRPRTMRLVHGHRPRPCGAHLRDARRHRRGRGDRHPRGARDARTSASDPESLHRRAGGAMRVLPERRHSHREGCPRSESEGDRRRTAAGDVDGVVPLLHARADVEGDQALRGGADAMTRDAAGALRRAGFSRRDFLKTSGALVVTFSAASVLDRTGLAQGQFGTRASHIDPSQVDSWLAIAADGTVTAYTGKCELGQGILTAQTQLVAEELSVPLDRVTLIMCDTQVSPDQGTTSGSQSTPTNFNERNLALAAATARQALLKLASQRLNVPVDQLTASEGFVSMTSDRGGRRVSYGDLVSGKKLSVKMDGTASRKPPSSWTVLGRPAPRLDMTAMATGRFEFVHNVRVPGLLYGAVG